VNWKFSQGFIMGSLFRNVGATTNRQQSVIGKD
jgi:hypothetical protein